MSKRVAIAAGILATIISAGVLKGTDDLHRWSMEEALNIILNGSTDIDKHRYSSEEALNILANAALVDTEQDTLVGVVTFVWDDNSIELSVDSSYVASMHSRGLVGGLAFEPQGVIYGDTTTLMLSISDAYGLKNRGWDFGTVGWDETSTLYNGDISLLAQGYTQAQEDTFYNNVHRAVLAQRDTLGLGMPQWISHSNASSAFITKMAAARAGLLYGYGPAQSVTGSGSFSATSGMSLRQNEIYNVDVANWGIWGTGGSTGSAVAAIPGLTLDRYEILQTIGETNTFAQWKARLDRAAQTHGLFVFIGHRPSTIAASTGVSFDSLMSYIKTRYIDTGLLVCKTPTEAAHHFYRDTFSPAANFAPGKGNFDDIDGDGHLDGWFNGTGATFTVADTAFIRPWGTATSGHNGKKAYSLNWAGEGNGTAWANQTADAAHESAKACLGIIPPAGGGWTVQFEAWIIADSAGASYSGVSGDTVGVSFAGPHELRVNKWGNNVPVLGYVTDNTGGYAPSITHAYSNTVGGNLIRLGSRNKADLTGTNKEWAHLVATWDVPEFADYLFINFWKTAQSPARGIVFSDYSVKFYKR